MKALKNVMMMGIGVVIGVVLTAMAVWLFMPGMMIAVEKSNLPFDETVQTLQAAIKTQGWQSPATLDMNKSLAKHGQSLERRVKVIQMCHPEYAKSVLETDRHVAALMPCAVAVWENDAGEVMVSKMNTGLMGKMFGGNIAKVMGGYVAEDEAAILSSVTRPRTSQAETR